MYKGVEYKYDSLKETVAMLAYKREKTLEYIKPMFSVVSPEGVEKIVKQYREYMFPEERGDSLDQLKKTREFFKKLKGVNLYVSV